MRTIVHADNSPCGQSSIRTIVHWTFVQKDICPNHNISIGIFVFKRSVLLQIIIRVQKCRVHKWPVHEDNCLLDICPELYSSNTQFFNRLICIQKKLIRTTIWMHVWKIITRSKNMHVINEQFQSSNQFSLGFCININLSCMH